MEEDRKEYRFGTAEDILRASEVEPVESDRKTEVDGGVLLTSGIHVYLPQYEINVHEGFFCHMDNGRLVPLSFLTVICDKADKGFLYDAEENFVDTVHEWLEGQCTLEQLEQEPCEVKGIGKGFIHGKSIQTGKSGGNSCGDGGTCRSAGRLSGKR